MGKSLKSENTDGSNHDNGQSLMGLASPHEKVRNQLLDMAELWGNVLQDHRDTFIGKGYTEEEAHELSVEAVLYLFRQSKEI